MRKVELSAVTVANVDARCTDIWTHTRTDRKLALSISSDDALYLYKVL